MTKDEIFAARVTAGKSIIEADAALTAAREAGAALGLDSRNLQNILYVDGRERIHSVLVNGLAVKR